jgi:hypothetical protein
MAARDRAELLRDLAGLPPEERDAAVERALLIDGPASASAPGAELVGYHASGVAAIVRFLLEVPLGPDDVLVDLGSGLGKVILLASLLTPARARGIELQRELVERAREAARALELDATFVEGDVRAIPLEGTVFCLYSPCTPRVLDSILARLRPIAERRAIVVGALGIDVRADWLVRRELDSFWLSIYDSVVPNVPPRVEPRRTIPLDAATKIARELA